MTLYRQIQYMRHQDLGIEIEERLVLRNSGSSDSLSLTKNQAFIDILKGHSDVQTVVSSDDVPGKEVGSSWSLRWNKMPETALKRCRTFSIDHQFIGEFGLDLVSGRSFSNEFGTEENNVILNETAAKILGFDDPDAAVGQVIVPSNPEDFQGTIVGVIKDYHQESLRFDFKPIIYFYESGNPTYFTLKINTSDVAGLLAFVESKWTTTFPDKPFRHFFLNDFFERQHTADLQFGWVIGLFTILAILVACLGLFGLSIFTVSRRMKEIGIRKVLGASIAQILVLISKEYVRLLILASLIGLPLAWYFSRQWLNNYAFKTDLNVWFFILPVAILLLISWLTVAGQSLKAAISNPIKSLRSE